MLLLAVFSGAWAQDETLDFTAQSYTNAQVVASLSGTDCQITFTGGATKATYYTTGTAIRIYSGGAFTVSSTTKSISKLVLTFSGTTNVPGASGAATVDTGTFDTSTMTWTSSSSAGDASVTFTREAVSGHWRMQKIDVYYATANDTRTPTTLTFANPDGYNYYLGDGTHTETNVATLDPAVAGATITYASDNETVATVDANGVLTVNDALGTANITASFAGDDSYMPSTAKYTVSVNTLYASIAELKAATPATGVLRLTDAKVTYVNGVHHYLQDATGAIDLYTSAVNYTAGQTLNGTATVSSVFYNNLPEITAFNANSDLTVTDGTAPEPTEMSVADAMIDGNLCKYIKMTGATVTGGNVTDGTNSLQLYDTYKQGLKFTNDGTYDIVAIPIIYKTTYELAVISMSMKQTIGANGYSTLYYSNLGFTVPEGVTATTYMVSNQTLTESVKHTAGEVIPAGEAVVLQGAAGDYMFPVSTAAATADANNQLMGTDTETALTADATKYFYWLSTNAAGDAGSVGFYWGAADGAAFTNGAHKAYLALNKTAAAKSFFLFDGTTGISQISAGNELDSNAPIYNLAGQRVSKNYRGVVIQNGKKHIVR